MSSRASLGEQLRYYLHYSRLIFLPTYLEKLQTLSPEERLAPLIEPDKYGETAVHRATLLRDDDLLTSFFKNIEELPTDQMRLNALTPIDNNNRDTPLHRAVRATNEVAVAHFLRLIKTLPDEMVSKAILAPNGLGHRPLRINSAPKITRLFYADFFDLLTTAGF